MKIVNFGSLNLDYVYHVPHFVQAGETIASTSREVFSGGKGLNQSVALSKAGMDVYHAGFVGSDGDILIDTLKENGVHLDFVKKLDGAGGHTVIQVDPNGQNSIIAHGGTNRMFTQEYIKEVLSNFSEGDIVVVQNEINLVGFIAKEAHKKGLRVVLNPSPWDENLIDVPFEMIDYLIINEIEGMCLSGSSKIDEIIPLVNKKYPNLKIVLTLGKEGAKYFDGNEEFYHPAVPADVVDTTGAGDTFLGYFIFGLANRLSPISILSLASRASAIAVARSGAAVSIPMYAEVG